MEEKNTNKEISGNLRARKIIYYVFGVLEVLFAFRLIFKILGANPQSGFVAFIYSITMLFLTPFIGIFRMAVSNGIETQSVLEPTLLIAMIVYAASCWGIVQLVKISSNRGNPET
jgi:hypothetical protein